MVNMTADLNDTVPMQVTSFDSIVSGRRRDDTRPVRRTPQLRLRKRAQHAKPGALAAKLQAFAAGIRFGSMAGAALLVLAVSLAAGTK